LRFWVCHWYVLFNICIIINSDCFYYPRHSLDQHWTDWLERVFTYCCCRELLVLGLVSCWRPVNSQDINYTYDFHRKRTPAWTWVQMLVLPWLQQNRKTATVVLSSAAYSIQLPPLFSFVIMHYFILKREFLYPLNYLTKNKKERGRKPQTIICLTKNSLINWTQYIS
jgi:hypothetical protein